MKKIILIIILILLVGCEKRNISIVLNPGYDIVGMDTTWIDEGCTLNINSSLSIEMEVYSNNVDLTTPGEYNVIYHEEYGGELHTCLRIVKVIDDIAPTVTLNSGIDTIKKGEEWIDTGVIITDNLDDTFFTQVLGTVNINVIGTYEIEYTAIDDAGNVTIVIRIVNVIE